MTSLGIGLRSRQVPPREDTDLPLGAEVEEGGEANELVYREASVPAEYEEFEDAVLFADLEGMENVLSAGGQLKFTGDPGGPTLTHLRQSWAATEVDLKLKPATVGLTDNDRFHLLVRLTGGGAREQCGLLQETLQEEVKARNGPIQREYERALRTYEGELAVYDALTAEQQADVDQPEPPEEPVLSNSFIQPVVRFWNLLENLYPERSTARITEFREFQMKPGESMANMVSRLQTLKLVLRQPEPTSVFKFLDAIRPKMLADKVKDILRVKEMDPNSWTVKTVGDIAIRLEKAQGEETLWTTSKSAVVPSTMSSGTAAKSQASITCFRCGQQGHMQNKCPVQQKTSKSFRNFKKTTKKAVTNARSGFANPKANRSEERRCYTCNKPGHIAIHCPQTKGSSNITTQLKGKPWCVHHKINTHSSDSCWALHPELRPSTYKERAAQSGRQAKVIPAKAGSSLSAKLKPALLDTVKNSQLDANQPMDSYFAEEVFIEDADILAELFTATAGAAKKERRSAESQGLRRVTQADIPLSFLPHPDVPEKEKVAETTAPMPVLAPVVVEDELGRFTPRQYRAPRVGKVYGGKDEINKDSLDAADSDHHANKEPDKETMPESFGYLSESDQNYQGALEFVTLKQLTKESSMLKSIENESADHEDSGQSETPQEGRPSETFEDESTKILKNLPSGVHTSLIKGQELAKDIPADVTLTSELLAPGTPRKQRSGLHTREWATGEKNEDGKSASPEQSTFDKSMKPTTFATVVDDPNTEPELYSNVAARINSICDPAPLDWTVQDRNKYHQVELQALLGGPIPVDMQEIIRELGQKSVDGWLRAVTRQVFRPLPRPGFHSAIFKRKRLLGRACYPTFLDMGPSNTESLELQSLQMARISVAQEAKHFGNLLRKPGQVLFTPGQYKLLGARIVVLLKDISELPLLPIYTRPGSEALGEATRLEVEYGLALLGYMLEVACGFYYNTVSLEGRANKAAILLVEFWWWLHRKADYMERVEQDRKRDHPRVSGASLVSYRKILHDADIWSDKMLFNHLAYAAMRCSDQGFVTLDHLLSPVEIGPLKSGQQMAQYKEATLVQKGPARDAFVGTLSQQLADRLQNCRQFIREEATTLGTEEPVAPIAPLTLHTADKEEIVAPAVKKMKKTPKTTRYASQDGVPRRSVRIAAARSMREAAQDFANEKEQPAEQAKELMLLARACATEMEVAEDDAEFEVIQGKDSRRESELLCAESKESPLQTADGTIKTQFYEYPRKIVALLELGYLKELEQGVFLRIPIPSQRKVHPDLSKLARKVQRSQREQNIFDILLDACQLIALGNDIFCDAIFHRTSQQLESSKKEGEVVNTTPAIYNKEPMIRDAYLAIVETGPELTYEYPPLLTALTETGFLDEYDKGVFKCVRDPKLQRRAFNPGALARHALEDGLEEIFFKILKQQGELFECSEADTYERYWDKVRETFAQAKFKGASYREAVTASLSAESTTAMTTVSRAYTAQVELCDVSNDGLSALLGSLPASYSCDRNLGTHKAPRVDNSNPYKVALTVNGRILQHVIVDTGCEMVVVGRTAARQAGIRPSMMRSGAVALRCADERVTKAFDRTIDPIPFVFNPGTEDETTVMAQVVVTNSEADTMLLGMSVIGKIGLVPNPYKGTLKYYVDWETQGSRSAHLACVFDVDLGRRVRKSVRSTACEAVDCRSALVMPIVDAPKNDFECWASRLHYQDYYRQLVGQLALSCSQLVLSALKETEAKPPLISLDGYRSLRPLNQDIVDITKSVIGQGLVVVELCGGILSSTEALIRTGIKIRKLHVCEIDPEARALAAARLEVLSKMFPELLPPEAFASCFSSLPQDIALIKHEHIKELGPVDLIICGFPCQGFSRASRAAQGLRDSRSSVFFDMVDVIHGITYEHGNCGWLIENVDASDHRNALVRDEYNQVVCGVLGNGYAFDAVAVGSYAHRFRRFWTNLIPTTLLHKMVKRHFASRSSEQSVQDILEPGRKAQLALHSRSPGPQSVNIVGQPLKAFSTFVTLKQSDAYRSQAQSLVCSASQQLEAPSLLEKERAMGYLGGMSQLLTPPLNESSCLRLLGGSMDLFQLTFLFGSVLAFQKGWLTS